MAGSGLERRPTLEAATCHMPPGSIQGSPPGGDPGGGLDDRVIPGSRPGIPCFAVFSQGQGLVSGIPDLDPDKLLQNTGYQISTLALSVDPPSRLPPATCHLGPSRGPPQVAIQVVASTIESSQGQGLVSRVLQCYLRVKVWYPGYQTLTLR